jgi:hypothetical protein
MPSIAKFFGRTGTRSKYGKTPERKLPAEVEQSVEIVEEDVDKDKKDKDKVEKDVESAEDKKEVEKAGAPVDKKGKTVVKKNIASDKTGTGASSSASGFFSRLWATVITHQMHAVTFTDNVSFVPNALPLFTLCNIFFELVGRSNWIEKHETTFNPYAAATAICYLYYIQILRAKEAAGALIGEETSILNRFRKCFPEEKIDIPGVFVPYFESIVATEPADNKYPWIVPHYGSLEHLTGMNEFHRETNLNYLRPMIPLMLANLLTFACTAPTDLDAHIVEETFLPVNLHPNANANQVRVYNQNFDFSPAVVGPPVQGAAAFTEQMRVFITGGMNVRFAFYNENYAAAHTAIRRTNFFGTIGVDVGSTHNLRFPQGGNALESRNFSSLENFLYLQKSKSGHWADYIFTQLSIAAKHCTENRNLSEIATTGGMESTILCHLRTFQSINHNGANRFTFENADLGIADSSHVHWFRNDLMRNLTGRFETSRADVERNEELQAFALGINARLPIHNSTFNTQGSFFNHAQNANGPEDAMKYSEHGDAADTVRGPVHMYEGWEQNVVRPGFLNKPVGM